MPRLVKHARQIRARIPKNTATKTYLTARTPLLFCEGEPSDGGLYDTANSGGGGGVSICLAMGPEAGSAACCCMRVEALHNGMPLPNGEGLHMSGLPSKFLQVVTYLRSNIPQS